MSQERVSRNYRIPIREYLMLAGIGLLGVAGIIPYLMDLYGGTQVDLPIGTIALAAVVQGGILTLILAYLGLLLSRVTGIGRLPAVRSRILPALGIGAAVGIVIILLDALVFVPLLNIADTVLSIPWWKGLLASFYGGGVEEILFRLFLVNLVVWILMKIKSRETASYRQALAAIVFSALLFGFFHLPAAAAVAPLTVLMVARVMLLNAVGGVVFGILYYRWGILFAMAAHFCADLILHVVPNLIS